MNVLPSVTPILKEVQQRFNGQLQAVHAPRPNEIYFTGQMDLVPGFCGHLYKKWKARLVSLFADDARVSTGAFQLYYVYALDPARAFFILRVPVSLDHPEFISLTNAVPAVNWQEREIQDLFGLKLIGHPNARRCALHDDWPEVYPLRKDFDLRTQLPPFTGERHKFRPVEGEGVFQVPVGPVHAGIIEPGHFLFSVAGEPVLYLQIRLFYTHKGTEKLFENVPVTHGVRLAESISGDSSFAHATAFCQAIERAADVEAPPRARADRIALGYVEGWRGEIFHWIRTAPGNRLARCKVKDPSLQNWPALSEAILGNIIPDFPVVNKSFNLSYSGTDR